MIKLDRRWKRSVGAAVALSLFSGCGALSARNGSSMALRERHSFFSVEWWTPLVRSPLLEYAPRETATPALDEETRRVVTLTRDGAVTCLTPEGEIAWTVKAASSFIEGALISEGVVFAPGGDGVLYALDLVTGKPRWKYDAGEPLGTVPVRTGDLLLVASENDTLFVVNAKTGAMVWQYRRDPPTGLTLYGASTPTVVGNTVYRGSADGFVVALGLEDGTVLWERALATPGVAFGDVDSQPVLDEAGKLYVASFKGGVFALNAETGEVLWKNATQGITSLIVRGEVLFGTGDDRLEALHTESGRALWSTQLDGRAGRTPLLSKGMLLVPTQKALIFVDAATGRSQLRWNPGRGVSATPRALGSHVFVLSNLGYLYAVELEGNRG